MSVSRLNNQVGPVVHPDRRTMQRRGVGYDDQEKRKQSKRWKFVSVMAGYTGIELTINIDILNNRLGLECK